MFIAQRLVGPCKQLKQKIQIQLARGRPVGYFTIKPGQEFQLGACNCETIQVVVRVELTPGSAVL